MHGRLHPPRWHWQYGAQEKLPGAKTGAGPETRPVSEKGGEVLGRFRGPKLVAERGGSGRWEEAPGKAAWFGGRRW